MVPDALSPVAPARVRCLLVPTGRITRPRFLDFVKRLQNESIVRLGDVSPNSQPGRETFSPQAFPSGVVMYDLTVADPTPGQRALYPFEISREPLVILGLADRQEYVGSEQINNGVDLEAPRLGLEDLRIDLEQTLESIRAIHSVALVHRVFLFDYAQAEDLGIDAVVSVPASEKPPTTALKTKMCDVTSALLSEMAPYSRSIQGLSTIETPRQAMPEGYVRPQAEADSDTKRQSWFPGSALRSSSPGLGLDRLRNRASLPAHLFGSSSSPSPSPSDEHPHSEANSPSVENAATTFEQMHIQSPERRQTGMDGTSNHLSVQSLGSDATSERGRNQGRGRISIVLGSMHLIAGRWPDAVKELIQGGLAARSTNDHVWHAKAVDLILVTLLLCGWSGIEFEIPPICLPIAERSSVLLGKSSKKNDNMANETFVHGAASREVQIENIKTLASVLPEIVQHIIRLYTRTTAEPVAQLLLSDTYIRLSKLSTILLYCPDLTENNAIEAIVLNRRLKIDSKSDTILSLQSPAKAEIASIALASIPALGVQEMLQYIDRLSIHAGVAAVLGMLGYHRKKAFLLRELLELLLPALENGDSDGSFEHNPLANAHGHHNGANGHVDQPNGDQRQDEPGAMYDFLLQICRVYGAVIAPAVDDLDKKRLSRFSQQKRPEPGESPMDEGALLASRIENEAMTRRFGSRRLKMDVLFACISICEAIPDLRGAISFSSSLLRTVSSGIAPGPQTVDGGPSLNPEGQARVNDTLHRAAHTAESLGIGSIQAEYWDDFLVREVEILPLSSDLTVTKRKRSELAAVQQSLAKKSEGPFIVNQFNTRVSVSKQEHFVVAKEKFCFSILLQNLYDVALDFDSLEMDITGAEVESKMENFSIGAYQTQRLRVVAEAKQSGKISVHGCIVKILNCSLRKYPIFKDNWRLKEDLRIKQHGLDLLLDSKNRPASTASDITKATTSGRPTPSIVQATVVDAQPRMTVEKTSLVQNNVMVLEGERRRFVVTVRNSSEQDIDFVALSFNDSTLPILQAAVHDRELPAADLYEVEYGIYRKAALTWPGSSDNVRLNPGQQSEFEVEVLGKPGLSSGVVHFDYASLNSKSTDSGEDIYTRRTSLSFTITVNPSVDLIRNDVLSLTGPLAHMRPKLLSAPVSDSSQTPMSKADWADQMLEPVRDRLLIHDDTIDQCLFVLDFYNSWTSTLIVLPQIRRAVDGSSDDWEDILRLSEPVDPGQSTRFLVPVPRLNMKDPYAPIPSLNPASKRQFVVSAGKVSEAYERSSRDAFWHREELLKHIRVGWLDPTTGRNGSIELRAIRLTVRMLDALKLEGLVVNLSIEGGSNTSQRGPDHFTVAADDFVTITSKLTNRSPQPIHPILRLQPSIRNQPYNIALDMSKKFAFTGLLQQPLPLLQPGESTEAQLGAVFLCSGEFEISASVEEMRIWKSPGGGDKHRQRAGSLADLDVLSSEQRDRRIWFAKEPCKIDVYDPEDK